MPRQKQSRGHCVFCGHETTRAYMEKHLAACPQRQAQFAIANESKRKPETLWHMRVRDQYDGNYWLDLEVRGSATLQQIDKYLRAIWLECCGHLSQFSIGGWQGGKIAMRRSVDEVFQLGLELTHIYDFGTSSYTLVKAVASRTGAPLSDHPIFLMARNDLPEYPCIECGAPATHFCMECMMEGDGGALCETHAQNHPHAEDEAVIEFVNSPRLGLCGYEGPADPPY